ncbi:MAG: hypothetical protein SR3Q1_10525 [Quinella sp. 3Q1]|nr:hypothetical protein [Quinella sp. 3Q1]MBR3050018.1 hypothetical protein [Selenomonadaceae bacterium]MBR6887465.1 hypothetical protein [Selenomonadaceae bacterium]
MKKAWGAANKNIVREFLGEGCLLGAFGGLLGSGRGIYLRNIITACPT